MHFLQILIFVFIIAFILNVAWEHLHSLLHVHYKGGDITNIILLRAAFFDAAVITLVAVFLTAHRTKSVKISSKGFETCSSYVTMK